ncbi:MAG: hypothetical protein AAF558_15215, partial [Verrucomicrobiota bacterium]
AIRTQLYSPVLGFGAVKEYPKGYSGWGDIDSGPVILGLSFSATGFFIASAKLESDPSMFRRLYATVEFAGIPISRSDSKEYLTAGPLGNAIMLAMFSAREWN